MTSDPIEHKELCPVCKSPLDITHNHWREDKFYYVRCLEKTCSASRNPGGVFARTLDECLALFRKYAEHHETNPF